MRWLISFLMSYCFFTSQVAAQTGKGMVIFADAVYHNGKIVTVDERFSVSQALAVRDGKIMAVGSNSEILALAGPKTLQLDLKGKSVLPGFIDTHSHLFDYAPANWANDLEKLEPELAQYRQTEVRVTILRRSDRSLEGDACENSRGQDRPRATPTVQRR